MSNVTDSYLAHHGILGMRCGHRKIDPFANHQANIQKRAEENGLSKKKAEQVAKSRITAEKVLLVAGGVSLGVAATYTAAGAEISLLRSNKYVSKNKKTGGA